MRNQIRYIVRYSKLVHREPKSKDPGCSIKCTRVARKEARFNQTVGQKIDPNTFLGAPDNF